MSDDDSYSWIAWAVSIPLALAVGYGFASLLHSVGVLHGRPNWHALVDGILVGVIIIQRRRSGSS